MTNQQKGKLLSQNQSAQKAQARVQITTAQQVSERAVNQCNCLCS